MKKGNRYKRRQKAPYVKTAEKPEAGVKMDKINQDIEELLSSIRRSEAYVEYKKQEAILYDFPELAERVNQFRADNFRLQEEANSGDLFQVVEKIADESAQLRSIPEVNAYLDAELALCKLMQKVCRTLTEGVEICVPDI